VTGCGTNLGGSVVGVVGRGGDDFAHRRSSRGEGGGPTVRQVGGGIVSAVGGRPTVGRAGGGDDGFRFKGGDGRRRHVATAW
jgi:hypothetical protein